MAKIAQRRAYREEREAVAEDFIAKVRQVLMGNELARIRAKLELRKEITRDYRDKYQKVSEELLNIKSDINT